jgi:hypothetical protein
MESTVIVFSDVLLQLTRAGKPLEPADADQIAALCQQGIALVVCSEQAAGEVKRIQTALGLSQPMICDGGETVIVPRDCGAPGDRSRQEDRIIRCEPFDPCAETAGTGASRYQRGVDVIVKLFGRDRPVMTLGLTDPTKPDNLLPLVDQTIFVGAEDGGRGALEVADWVAAITDAAEHLRSARRRSLPTPLPWRSSPQAQLRPTAGRAGSYRLSQAGARPN